ncbi:hypothetical protein Tco_1547642 [Tanacetum coccineum]
MFVDKIWISDSPNEAEDLKTLVERRRENRDAVAQLDKASTSEKSHRITEYTPGEGRKSIDPGRSNPDSASKVRINHFAWWKCDVSKFIGELLKGIVASLRNRETRTSYFDLIINEVRLVLLNGVMFSYYDCVFIMARSIISSQCNVNHSTSEFVRTVYQDEGDRGIRSHNQAMTKSAENVNSPTGTKEFSCISDRQCKSHRLASSRVILRVEYNLGYAGVTRNPLVNHKVSLKKGAHTNDIEETDDERTNSENGDQVMTYAEKNVAEKLGEEKVEIIKDHAYTEINSLLDVQIQQIPPVLSAPLLDVLLSVIPPPTTTTTTPTPLTTPLTTPPITITTQPVTSPLPANKALDAPGSLSEELTIVLQRVSTLEKDVKELKKVDHTTVLQKHTEELKQELKQQESHKHVYEIIKTKQEHAVKEKMSKYSTKPFDQTTENGYKQKDILFQMMIASKSYKKHLAYKALYNALIQSLLMDEDDMDRATDVEPSP